MQDGRLKALGQTLVSSNVAKTLVLILFGCCALLPIVSGAFKTVYGREFLFKAFTYQINSQSSPDCAGDVRIVTLPPLPRGGGLRHGIYHNERASDLAADFIHEAYGLENTS